MQSETDLTNQLRLVLALRVDDHNHLPDPVVSPRAAVVFKATPTNNFRVTYNRAFSTPTTNNLFLDLTSTVDAFGLGAAFEPILGFAPSTDVRAFGVPSNTGLNFSRSTNGLPQYRSPFAPLDPRGLNESSFIDLNDPIFNNVMWSVGSGAVNSQFIPAYVQGLIGAGFFPGSGWSVSPTVSKRCCSRNNQ